MYGGTWGGMGGTGGDIVGYGWDMGGILGRGVLEGSWGASGEYGRCWEGDIRVWVAMGAGGGTGGCDSP